MSDTATDEIDDDEEVPGKELLRMQAIRNAAVLRDAGMDWDDIAREVGYSTGSSIARAVRNYTKNIPYEAADELRQRNYQRLNYMLSRVWAGVVAGESAAIRDALAIIDKMDKLMGTELTKEEGPVTNNILVIEGDKAAYISRLQTMAGRLPVPPVGNGAPAVTPPKPKARTKKAAVLETTATEEAGQDKPCGRYTRPRGSDPGSNCRCGYPKDAHG